MKPFYSDVLATIYLGDCREVLPALNVFPNVIIADPPYEETRLKWDQWPYGWPGVARACVRECASLWCFGSTRVFMKHAQEFELWDYAQDVVWEKANGSSMHSDRFRKVHEIAVHWYCGPWKKLHKRPLFTHDGTAKTIRRKFKPAHWAQMGAGIYRSEDGGPRLMRSVMFAPGPHGKAIHPTQKPEEVVANLVGYSCPPQGLVVDMFLGGGTTLRVCKDLGIQSIGIEGDEAAAEKAANRISQEVLIRP